MSRGTAILLFIVLFVIIAGLAYGEEELEELEREVRGRRCFRGKCGVQVRG